MTEVGNGIEFDQEEVIDIEDQIIEIDLSMDKTIGKGLNMFIIIAEESLGDKTIEEHKIIEDKLLEGNIEVTTGIVILMRVDRQCSEKFRRNNKSSARSRWGERSSTNRDRIRFLKCREYDHFAKDILTGETYDSLTRANPEEMIAHLN